MSSVTELGYIGIGVSDLGAWKSFAAEVLGLEIAQDAETASCRFRMDYWHHRILVHATGSDDIEFVGWRVPWEEDLEEIEGRFDRAGLRYQRATADEAAQRGVLGFTKVTDPGGIRTEIFFGPRIDYDVPFHPGRRVHGPFVTGKRGFGHVVLEQPDLAAAQAFYTRQLGMSGHVEFERTMPNGSLSKMHFMSCNSRQHSLAFSTGKRPKRISHAMIECARIEDVGLTRDIAKARQIKIGMDIGQHFNDRAVSFYMETPSGWSIEVGWGVVPPSGQAEYGARDIWGHGAP